MLMTLLNGVKKRGGGLGEGAQPSEFLGSTWAWELKQK